MRWWRDVHPDIFQPALDHHYITMHLGGPKQVQRRGEGKVAFADIEAGSLSIVPAGSTFHWKTRGPIEFAHLYIAPAMIGRLAVEELDRDASALSLEDPVGARDPLLQSLFLTLLEGVAPPSTATRLYLDTLLHALLLRLLSRYALAPSAPLKMRHSLAPARLRRVIDFIEANLEADIGLSDLAAVGASSPFHFSRAFASVTGQPPYAYLVSRRIERAKTLLLDDAVSLEAIAIQCGFHSAAHFSRMFKRATGLSPIKYRLL